ncbi:DUF3549 family protein [Marinomonas mediterranea]|jgi:Protein of unknown function (DUF3549).|uniref:DUF3549 domain-containing protein n=1 Tax=Marinomonas mediterranea (strain ATCC 700492 / JCM 21426 / NBRC 103028 / MMB-1) TaxID=717774 RepID=F2JVU3_MARM1|nr:DUF3549 family protein [Marinomonas mediterranea]ADZ91729.1 hypothetical protein Marme_2497 [Marinomonas mediterranea MMB-1]WCN09689.1 DUF3549 family protein [Marinomonas mediterranea]WCN17825.1 DUF3549 family protein [Marinomonas mediterranea MMB-1]
MNQIESLSDLFNLVDCHVTYFDIGRRVQKLTPQQVIQFDKKQQAYPYPFQKHAWLACALLPKDSKNKADDSVIWFIRLPIDEKGALNLGTRDHFIKSIVDRILNKGTEQGLNEALEDNPYAFKPDQERMANFHAIMACALNQPSSLYYEDVKTYLSQNLPDEDGTWSQLGLQGIADLAARHAEASTEALIANAIKRAPLPLSMALCNCLEHHSLSSSLSSDIESIATLEERPEVLAGYVRALSSGDLSAPLNLALFKAIGDISSCDDTHIHLLTALSAKCPHWLSKEPALLRVIMEKLAHREDGWLGFKQIVGELTQHPETNSPLWVLLRSEHISSTLKKAVESLFSPQTHTIQ